jgi:hypothetical protein
MNDELTRGLTMLADEAEPVAIDVYGVIDTAKKRTRNRRASAASAFGTVAIVGALAMTIGFGGADGSSPTAGAQSTTTVSPSPVETQYADLLADHLPTALRPGATFSVATGSDDDDDPSTGRLISISGTGIEVTVLAHATLTDQEGSTNLDVTATETVADFTFSPCRTDATLCETRTVGNGATASLIADYPSGDGTGRVSELEIRLPDQVIVLHERNIDLDDGTVSRPELMLDVEQMFALAEAFTY